VPILCKDTIYIGRNVVIAGAPFPILFVSPVKGERYPWDTFKLKTIANSRNSSPESSKCEERYAAMKNKHWMHRVIGILGLSVVLVTGHPIVSRAQWGYNPNPYLYSARGRVLHEIDNRLYAPNFSWTNPAQGIPIGTMITTDGNATVVLEYSWPSDLSSTPCISRVVMNNRGQRAKWFSYQVKRYDTPGQCDVTDDAKLQEIQWKLTLFCQTGLKP
jgi:hypothetical protein